MTAAEPERKTNRKKSNAGENYLALALSLLNGVGPRRLEMLKTMGLETISDLVFFFPRRYVDRRNISHINGLVPGRPSVVSASVETTERRRLNGGLELLLCRVSDGTGELSVSWFNRKGLEYILKEGTGVMLYGTPLFRFGKLEMSNPDFEVADGSAGKSGFTGIVPLYPSVAGMPRRWFLKTITGVVEKAIPLIKETLPDKILKKRNLMPLADALRAMHRPSSEDEWGRARRRMAYEELFHLQVEMAERRRRAKKSGNAAKIDGEGEIYHAFISSLPYAPTDSQEKALSEIFADASSGVPMTRLLQGDVGSGKTLVALGLAAAAADAGVQTALMAPTEVLACQLFAEAEKALSPAGVTCVIVKGGQSASERSDVTRRILDGSAQVAVGTQALIAGGVAFKKLGAVVIDEQHRFGVGQRAEMLERVPVPHLLMMSATPIPRTLAMCFFGDLDVSVLTEKPAGRRKIETRLIDMKSMGTLLQFIIDEAADGGRIFWICPRVDDDPAADAASTERRFAFITKHLGPLGVALLHGRLRPDEKDEALEKFRSGEVKVLVSTTVVEVGVDVPDASVIIVESPERFGLSQLHQLRGRVGRGRKRGVCVLLVKSLSGEVPDRLGIMLRTDDGFKIAEADLAFRGEGKLTGTAQHGQTGLRVADLAKDAELLRDAHEDALEITLSS